MGLMNGRACLESKLARIVERIKGFREGVLAVRAKEALSALACRAVFVCLRMAT